ncbi:hypothetical protein BDW72DRAFT_206279 [Aspergillus terricola var. indicus]
MDSPSSTRSSPSKALNPLSPERMNQQTTPNSPSTVSDTLRMQRKSQRGLSDVQARVAYLNNLARGGSPGGTTGSTSTGGAAALQRAILGREEAESALARVSSQLSEAQSRELRISERLESLLEELQNAKERQAHERLVFEKEIRKARKEAFRAGSALVKTQEELKHMRAEVKGLSQEVQSEREAKERAEQEAFERAYAVAGLTEELEEIKGKLRAAEAKNQAITLQHARAREIKKQEVNRMSLAEGDLALLMTPSPRKPKRPSDALGDELAQGPTQESAKPSSPAHQNTPPKKLVKLSDPLSPRYPHQFEENPPLTVQELVDRLQMELRWEKNERINAEKDVEFMQLQCMFKMCACRELESLENEARARKQERTAQKQEDEAIMKDCRIPEEESHQRSNDDPARIEPRDKEARQEQVRMQTQEREALEEIQQQEVQEESQESESREEEIEAEQTPEDEFMDEVQEEVGEPLITFSPVTGTFRTVPSPIRSPHKQLQDSSLHELQTSPLKVQTIPEAHSSSASPGQKDLTPEAHPSSVASQTQQQTEYENVQQNHVDHLNEIHNVKRIPLRSGDEALSSSVIAPGTPISREQALAQIRARRGRTSEMKRSVSASDAGFRAGGLNVTPARLARRIPGVQHATDPRGDGVKKSRRDMSAPMRVLR